MIPPAVVIRLGFEAAPSVYADCKDENECSRLELWLEHHPEYGALIDRALELAERERAA